MSRRLAVILLSVFAAVAAGVFTWERAEGDTYEQVVDNSDKDRFATSGSWKKSDSGKGISGDNYRFALPADKSAHALFKVEIPADGEYAVYVRWPEVPGLNDSVPVGVETAYGTKWTEVNQREDGGRWVRIGEFEMRGGEEYPVRISRDTDGEGNVVADAVKVVRVSSYEESDATAEASADAPSEQRLASATGYDVVRETRRYIDIPYRLGGPSACVPGRAMDCSCLTMTVYREFGKSLPDDPVVQYRYGRSVASSDLRPGDLVFYRENGPSRPITHVGIYSGNGYLVHASSYFGKVVESQMDYIRGYAGARRLV